MRIFTLFALCMVFLLSSCTNNKEDKVVLPGLPAVVYTDVPYGTDTLQKLDIYLPAGRSMEHTPVVLMLHGGGWYRADKSDYNTFGFDSSFLPNGYAFVNMNYRLVANDSTRFPVQLNDIDAALDAITAKAAEWKINSNAIATMGSSSGAHLALLEAFDGRMRTHVKTVISMSGFTDFTDTSVVDNTNIYGRVKDLMGVDYVDDKPLWAKASPIYYLDNAVPVLIFHGSADVVAYPIQTQRLRDSLDKRHIPCKYVVWQGYGHGLYPDWPQSKETMVEWLKEHLPR